MKKLVRDKIPEMIHGLGIRPFHMEIITDPKDRDDYLWKKFREETMEFMKDPCMEELADIVEIAYAIMGETDCYKLVDGVLEKRSKKGAFKEFYVMEFPDAN